MLIYKQLWLIVFLQMFWWFYGSVGYFFYWYYNLYLDYANVNLWSSLSALDISNLYTHLDATEHRWSLCLQRSIREYNSPNDRQTLSLNSQKVSLYNSLVCIKYYMSQNRLAVFKSSFKVCFSVEQKMLSHFPSSYWK
jgi:hypothetical protein